MGLRPRVLPLHGFAGEGLVQGRDGLAEVRVPPGELARRGTKSRCSYGAAWSAQSALVLEEATEALPPAVLVPLLGVGSGGGPELSRQGRWDAQAGRPL
jgi:hypothetical protein